MSSYRIDSAGAHVRVFAAGVVMLAGLLSACTESSTEPLPGPLPPPDTATYDLVFEQSSFPLNASHLRMRRRGEASNTLLFGRELLGIEPTASADGRTIVYQGYGGAVGDDSDLWLVRAGEEPARVPLPIGDTEFAPALSPDGSMLAYVRLGEDGNTQLWVSRIDGSDRRLLSANAPTAPAANASPDWSPDGQRLAWATGAPGALRIAVIKADGSGRQVVSAGVAGGSDIDAEWSPDGTRLVFVRTPAIVQSDLVVLTLATGAERSLGVSSRNRHPAWAPDGKTIVFASTLGQFDGDYELYSIQPDGTALTPLTDDDLNQRHPVWVRRQ
jgi:Tol biopolymer transport system component